MIKEKITKSQLKAKLKRLEDGETLSVTFLPNKISPNNLWGIGCDVKVSNQGVITQDEITDLDKFINSFQYYNCNNELGNRVAYYI